MGIELCKECEHRELCKLKDYLSKIPYKGIIKENTISRQHSDFTKFSEKLNILLENYCGYYISENH